MSSHYFTPTTNLVIDSNDKLVLQMNGTGNSFVDSSTANKKTVNQNGNATQIPLILGKQTAAFFNGTTDYVVVPNSSDFSVGTGDFTVEGYFLFNSVSATMVLFDIGSYAANYGISIDYYAAGTEIQVLYNGTGNLHNFSWTPSTNTWYHIAVVRASGVTNVYVNGSAIGSPWSNSTSISTSTYPATIGAYYNNTSTLPMNGWAKEIRISNVARYTTSFTPSTTEFTSDANTKLLMHFDTPATSPLGPAIYIPGNGNYLSTPNFNGMKVGTGDFTLEGTFNHTVVGTQPTYIALGRAADGAVMTYYSGTLYCYINNVVLSWSWTPVLNKSYHICLQRTSGQAYGFVDGRPLGASVANTYNIQTTNSFNIGEEPAVIGYGFQGYAREVRFSNISRYAVTGFTPSQTGFTIDPNTLVYVKGNENNGVTTFIDYSTSPNTFSRTGSCIIQYTEDYRSCIFIDSETIPKYPYPVGSAKVDFLVPFGTGAGLFDGTTAALTISNASGDFYFTGDFTAESYIRFATAGSGELWEVSQDGLNGLRSECSTTGFLFMSYVGNSAPFELAPGLSLSQNTWYHFAFTRYGNIWTVWINGTSVYTYTGAYTIPNFSGPLSIGAYYSSPGSFSNFFSGLMDNVVISNGIARYHSTFNPPLAFNANTYNNMTVISNPLTATTPFTSARLLLLEQDSGGVSLNTDLVGYVSRDGGTTWLQVMLASEGTDSSGNNIFAGTGTFTTQPAGTSMVYKIVTNNNKFLKVYGASLFWS